MWNEAGTGKGSCNPGYKAAAAAACWKGVVGFNVGVNEAKDPEINISVLN